MTALPLAGTTVLDLTRLTPGAYATMLLADLGARVIKIERPGDGDYLRTLVPAAYETVCRGKLSLTLDLKHPAGRDLFARLLAEASVVVESFRPGVAGRLGVDYPALAALRPDVIACSLSGYGQGGPYRELSGHDLNYLGVSGALGLMGRPDGPPEHATGIAVADFNAAVFTALSVVSAVLHRQLSGQGQHIDVSMTDCMLSWMVRYVNEAVTEPGASREAMMARPGYGVYQASDQRYLTLGCIEDVFWDNLLGLLPDGHELRAYDRPEKRRAEIGRVEELLRALIGSADRDHWLAVFRAADVPAGPAYALDEVPKDPQNLARGLRPVNPPSHETRVRGGTGFVEVPFPAKFSAFPPVERTAAPKLGEHTRDVLGAAGLTAAELDSLAAAGVI
jgi:crotonobetainyl-CoA:carnitine CoA-transferase CaiB-like acyl-CoA transferase